MNIKILSKIIICVNNVHQIHTKLCNNGWMISTKIKPRRKIVINLSLISIDNLTIETVLRTLSTVSKKRKTKANPYVSTCGSSDLKEESRRRKWEKKKGWILFDLDQPFSLFASPKNHCNPASKWAWWHSGALCRNELVVL